MKSSKLCLDCSKRDLCSSLCPEAEFYVSQDYVELKEFPIGLIFWSGDWPNGRIYSIDDLSKEIGNVLTKGEMRIWYLVEIGVGRDDICKLLRIKKKTLRNKLCLIKKKLNIK